MAAERRANFEPPSEWQIYKRQPGLVLGFHGCDRATGESLLDGRIRHLEPSQNKHDWLGNGIYFWEADPWRALAFAQEAMDKKYLTSRPIRDPYVVGASIDLGTCCNLLEIDAIAEVRRAYELLAEVFALAGVPMPKNTGKDLTKRDCDRAVIEHMHGRRRDVGISVYQTVRAAFIEGDPLYDDAGFSSKNHIQIAVRDRDCIKGYFRLPGL